MESRKKSSQELFYTKKPLLIAVPHLGDLQSRKNPFNSSQHLSTFFPTKSQTLLTLNEVVAAKFRANTVCNLKKMEYVRSQSSQVPIPARLTTEMSESITEDSCDWIVESEPEKAEDESDSLDEEIKRGEKPALDEKVAPLRAKMNREIEHNFMVMRSLIPATTEEVEVRKVKLDSYPEATSGKTLLLDLDDTLIHTINPSFNYSAMDVTHSTYHNVMYKDTEDSSFYSIKVVVRPHAIRLLKELSSIYEIAVILVTIYINSHNVTNSINRSLQQLRNITQMPY